MARRSGQAGTVVVKGNMWKGRYYEDVSGQADRVRKSLLIGPRSEMTKPEAKRKLRTLLEEMGINSASHLDRAIKPVQLFKQKAAWWEEHVLTTHKPSSQNSSHYIIKKHLVPYFGDLPLELINEEKVTEWISMLHKGKLAPKSVHNIYKVLRLVVGRQSREWVIRLPGIPEKEQRYFTPEEAKQIIDAAPGQYKALFALQFATGMRFGEIAGLHVEDLDFKESVVFIRRSTYQHLEVTPKTQAGHRQVDVDPETMAIVKEHIGDRKDGRVFSSQKGTPLVVNNVNRHVLKPICRKLKIPIGTTHAWRHGRISILQQNNVPGDLIKKWVGHTNLKTTSRYSHFPSDYRKEIVAKLGKVG
jgi:integrase